MCMHVYSTIGVTQSRSILMRYIDMCLVSDDMVNMGLAL